MNRNKYIYHSEVYKIWKNGACLLEDTYYVSDKPIKFSKSSLKLKKKDYSIYRYITLENSQDE